MKITPGMHFAIDLREWRHKRQLTQKQAAAALGVSTMAYGQWERAAQSPRPFVMTLIRKQILEVTQ